MGSARRDWKSALRREPQAPSAPARSSSTDSGAARADEGFWVAVLPFKYGGADADPSRRWPRG